MRRGQGRAGAREMGPNDSRRVRMIGKHRSKTIQRNFGARFRFRHARKRRHPDKVAGFQLKAHGRQDGELCRIREICA